MGPAGKAISDLHCIHKHKPTKRRRCIHRDCHVIWRTTAWSAVSKDHSYIPRDQWLDLDSMHARQSRDLRAVKHLGDSVVLESCCCSLCGKDHVIT